MQRRLKLSLAASVIAIALADDIWWWRARNSSQLSFRTTVVKRGDVESTINASGTIEPMEVVDVGAQVAGRIKSFGTDTEGKTVDYGSVVNKGAMLATIDDSVYAADLSVGKAGEMSAAAGLEQMQAKLVQAEAEWKRTEALYNSKLIAQTRKGATQSGFLRHPIAGQQRYH